MTSIQNELIQKIGQLIISDDETNNYEWVSLSLSFVSQDGVDSELSGYIYTINDWEAYLPENNGDEIIKNMLRFREVTKVDDQPNWVACLIQIRKIDKKIKYIFEYDNSMRWKVTPKNLHQMVEEMKIIAD